MNVTEMQKGVQQKLNAMEIPIVSEDVLWYLNRAQEQYIADQYVFLRGKYTDNQNIELYTNAQKAIENLRTIVVTQSITDDNTGDAELSDSVFYSNAKEVTLGTLSSPFYYYVRSQSKIHGNAFPGDLTDYELINNRLVEHENVQKYIKTKFNNPIFRDYLVIVEGDKLIVFYDNQSNAGLDSLVLTYIKEPKKLVRDVVDNATETATCELPVHTHREIVNLATLLARQDRKDEVSRTQRQNFEG